jgi:hypothetical protein
MGPGIDRRQLTLMLLAGLGAGGMNARRVLAAAAPSLPAYIGPWTPMFNKTDLTGWTFYQAGIGFTDTTNAVVNNNGQIEILGPRHTGGDRPGLGHLATAKEYGNYHLRFDYRFGEKRFEPRLLHKRNNGVLIHTFPEKDRVWPNCVELQLEESDVGDFGLMNTRCWPGADNGGTPAWPNNTPNAPRATFTTPDPRPPIERQRVIKNGNFERLMDWNTIEVLAIENRIAALVNGRIVNTIYDIEGQDTTDRSIWRPLTKGRILLEIEHAETTFRNVEIRMFAG